MSRQSVGRKAYNQLRWPGTRAVGGLMCFIAVVACHGEPLTGALGAVGSHPTPVAVSGGLTFASLTAGYSHTCGLTSGGIAYCWGLNTSGQLGRGDTLTAAMPAAVVGGFTFASLTAGDLHTCGVTSGGTAYCWGANYAGQLGDNSTTPRPTPVAVVGGLTFTSLTAGQLHTCGVTSGGTAYCWGQNNYGALGDATTTARMTPVAVAGGLTFASLTAGGMFHTCGVASAGAAYCWGFSIEGQLGDSSPSERTTPAAVVGGLTFVSLTAGGGHTCGATPAGAAYCWGDNSDGQLGTAPAIGQCGDAYCSAVPVAVVGGRTFASLVAGFEHTCGLTSAGAAYCWGWNYFGQLGNGTTSSLISPTSAPAAVVGGLTFASLTAGRNHTCGLTSSGTAYCWGDDEWSQLGVVNP